MRPMFGTGGKCRDRSTDSCPVPSPRELSGHSGTLFPTLPDASPSRLLEICSICADSVAGLRAREKNGEELPYHGRADSVQGGGSAQAGRSSDAHSRDKADTVSALLLS